MEDTEWEPDYILCETCGDEFVPEDPDQTECKGCSGELGYYIK